MAADGTGSVPSFDHVHTHAVTCYWDHREARWQCRGTAPTESTEPEPTTIAVHTVVPSPPVGGYARPAVTT